MREFAPELKLLERNTRYWWGHLLIALVLWTIALGIHLAPPSEIKTAFVGDDLLFWIGIVATVFTMRGLHYRTLSGILRRYLAPTPAPHANERASSSSANE